MKSLSQSILHIIPKDLSTAIVANDKSLYTWESITPIARNEWICWVESVKKEETRKSHVLRAVGDLANGKRRPCCWPGCPHR